MQRMIQTMARNTQPKAQVAETSNKGKSMSRMSGIVALAACLIWSLTSSGMAHAQMGGVVHADMDFAASGYVTPAGMLPPELGLGTNAGAVIPAGFFSEPGCDTISPCDAMPSCGCDGGCDGGCDQGLGMGLGLGSGGLLGKLQICKGCRGNGCGQCGGRGILNRGGGKPCLFCRGAGCSVCMSYGNGQILGGMAGLFSMMRPYSEASLCNQRWYDISVESTFLDRNIGGGTGGVFSTRGVAGVPVLTSSSINADDLEYGVRISGAVIFGAGGNLEVTYMGGNEWDNEASVTGNQDLFSFISEFGTNPPDDAGTPEFDAGFDDTDRSIRHSIRSRSVFHSGEINYRRRTMWPYCRFQSSWLLGLRHVRYDDSTIYSTIGTQNNSASGSLPRFFSSDGRVKNNYFGPQAGFDMWWNIIPGVSLGTGAKAAWVQNNANRDVTLSANSLGPLATPGTVVLTDGVDDATVIADFEFKFVYRLTHSITLRSAYYATVVDDFAFGSVDLSASRGFLNSAPVSLAPIQFDTLVLQGVSFGTEYMW